MTAENKLYLDTNRHHLQSIKNGTIRFIDIPKMLSVMREEFEPNYPTIADDMFEHVAKLVVDTYKHYDA